ncbi:unnamed protein product [Caenorhabditis angaria]|uniref:Uncharacterized protein n=1 Tax=Caenorhabditis angaria TaxID=860376 RepID=A0A9P1N674_9PELO|nr:unnamed protein product [Caenorhabditis angaria]
MYISPSFSTINCQICSKPSHGNHFGAISCRACSAFFRRAVLKNYSILRCKNGDGKCKGDICKRCRLEKCLKAGMSDKKFQLDRDLISSTRKNIPPSMEYFLGRPVFIIFCETDIPESNRSFIDFTKLIEKATNLFKNRGNKLYVGMNTLNQLTYALNQNHGETEPGFCWEIRKNDILKFWEANFLKVADWLTYCDKFQELPLQMRIQLLKSIWMAWICLQRNSLTANRKRQSGVEDKICYWSDDCLIDSENVELDISWITRYSREQFEYFIMPSGNFHMDSLIEPLLDLQPTNQELTYMLTIFTFRYAAKMFSGEFENLNEKIIEVLADDLHSFYLNEMKMKNYAGRMAKMMQIVNVLERDFHQKTEKVQLARIFNVITVDFSHPEMIFAAK